MSYGGHLSSIKSKTHNYFLLKMPNLQCASSYWVGGNYDRTVANQWAWVDKSGFAYRNWATGKPAFRNYGVCKAFFTTPRDQFRSFLYTTPYPPP